MKKSIFIVKAGVVINQFFAILGLLFSIAATAIFVVMVAAAYLHFDPPAWLSTQNDAVKYIGMSWLFFAISVVWNVLYVHTYMPPFFQKQRTLASIRV